MGIIGTFVKLIANKSSLIVIALLAIGIVIGVQLVQHTQIFRSRASVNVNAAFEIKDANGNEIYCDGNTCYTDSDRVEVRLKDVSVLEQ